MLLALAAYLTWGLMPLYFFAVQQVPPIVLLFHRIIWSFVCLLSIVWYLGKSQAFKIVLKEPKLLRNLSITSLLIACNWFLYIFSVSTKQVQQASLGYYLSPILNILLGRFALKEPMKKIHWISLTIAIAGSVQLTFLYGHIPILALGLAMTFSFYGLLRKVTDVDAILGLATETLMLLPLGFIGLIMYPNMGSFFDGKYCLAILVGMSGFVTIVPLLLFTAAASRVSLISLGFFQYISPTIQFLIAIFILEEKCGPAKFTGFIMIWISLILVSLDWIKINRKSHRYENFAD